MNPDLQKEPEQNIKANSSILGFAFIFLLASTVLAGVLYAMGVLSALWPSLFSLLVLIYWPLKAHFVYERKIRALEKKVEEIGQLTSRLRHDLGTPVMVVSSLTQLMQKLEDEGSLSREDIKKHLARIEDNSAKMMDLTQRFQKESRDLFPPTQHTDKI